MSYSEIRIFAPALEKNNALWCNGSTPVFGTVSHGSNPCRVTPLKLQDLFLEAFFISLYHTPQISKPTSKKIFFRYDNFQKLINFNSYSIKMGWLSV